MNFVATDYFMKRTIIEHIVQGQTDGTPTNALHEKEEDPSAKKNKFEGKPDHPTFFNTEQPQDDEDQVHIGPHPALVLTHLCS
jgi:hypothetical protein